MRQPYTRTIAGTGNFAALAAAPTSMRLCTITAVGDDVLIRRSTDDAAGHSAVILDGLTVTLINIDLAQVELNVPVAAAASVIASPH